MTAYTVPANPEAAALELIRRLPGEILQSDALTAMMHGYAAVLAEEHAFAGMDWHAARHVAAAMSFDVATRDDAADRLLNRSREALSGNDHALGRPGQGCAGVPHRRHHPRPVSEPSRLYDTYRVHDLDL